MGKGLMAVPTRTKTGREKWVLEPMRLTDMARVQEIERQSFNTPWPRESYRHEIEDNKMARYVVLRRDGPPPAPAGTQTKKARNGLIQGLFGRGRDKEAGPDIAGFAGLWLMVDEAHITTLAVAPEWRGRGLGELMLIGLIEQSAGFGANLITLEVRTSNGIAQRLYEKYGFYANGLRTHYYSDNGEDALVMWSEDLGGAAFKRRLALLKGKLAERLEWKYKP